MALFQGRIRAAFITPVSLLLALQAGAQTWPDKPVRIIVPFAAGGPADVYARVLGQKLQEALGQTFIVDDRPGGGAIVGAGAAAKSPADGYPCC